VLFTGSDAADAEETLASGFSPGRESMNDESLNLGEALRLAREKANRERTRAKCRKYYRNRMDKKKMGGRD
jgi:hypothetical protein